MGMQDLRHALRALARRPGFILAAVVTLALGIGGASAVFSVADAVLLRPLPFPDPGRLVLISANQGQDRRQPFSFPRFTFLEEKSRSFAGMAAFTSDVFSLTGRGEPEELEGARVSWKFFAVLGVQPALGRGFRPEDGRPGAAGVTLLGHNLWARRFGAARDIVGQDIALDGVSFTVAGVLPAGFAFAPLGSKVEVWIPKVGELSLESPAQIQAGAGYLNAVARLRQGVRPRRAQAESDALNRQYREANPNRPDGNPQTGMAVADLQSEIAADLRPALLTLLAAVGLVLLLACANVANLALTRALDRGKDAAIRAALGAGRWAMVRQSIAESLLLALAGAGAGLLLAHWGAQALVAFSHEDVLAAAGVRTDARVLLFAVAAAVAGGALVGLAPAVQFARTDLYAALRGTGRAGTISGPGGGRLRGALVVAQVGLSVVLLTGSGLLIRSFIRLRASDPGFDPKGVLTMRISLSPASYPKPSDMVAFHDAALRQVRTLPGVEAAAISSALPLNPTRMSPVLFEGQPSVPLGQRPIVNIQMIGADYAKVMRVPLLGGRGFAESDDAHSPPVAIVNQRAARRFWPNQNPLGKHVWLGRRTTPAEVVGVFGDTRNKELAAPPQPEVLVPFPQLPWATLRLSLRTAAEPKSLIAAARRAVLAVDKDQPVTEVRTLEDVLDQAGAPRRFTMYLLGAYSATALIVAAVGLYGLMAYSVAGRTRELGVRAALGASRSGILALVVGRGMRLTAAGIGFGIAGSFALTRLANSLLYQTSATDPWAFAGGAALLAMAGSVASYLPARRATRVDPMEALRYE